MAVNRNHCITPPSPFWSAVLDASYNGFIVIDREGIVAVYNQAAGRIFCEGYTSFVRRHIADTCPGSGQTCSASCKATGPRSGSS